MRWLASPYRPAATGAGMGPPGRGRAHARWWRPGGQGGYALVVVILVLLLVSFLVANLALDVRGELQAAHNLRQRLSGRFLAMAGINLALFRQKDKPLDAVGTDYERFLQGYPYEETAPAGGRFRYVLVSESGKIDLNTFPRGLMELFLAYHGLDEEQIAGIIDSVLDWRDPDDLHRLQGAEQDYYLSLDDPYIPRNGKILDPAEFFLVKGSEVLRGRFDPYQVFTIYNSRSRINFNSLTPQMLAFLCNGDQECVDLYYATQEEMPGLRLTVTDLQTILGPERYQELRPYLVPSSNNRYFYIEAVGEPGYDPAAEDSDEQVAPAHWPGLRIQTIYLWRGREPQYLFWKETFS